MYLMKNFQKGKRGGGGGEVLNFVTLHGSLRKNFAFFCKNNSTLRPFWLSFDLKDLL